MVDLRRLRATFFNLVAYYLVAIVNTIFGVTTGWLLLWAGLNVYVAQILAYGLGVTFNYFMYRRHVFRGSQPARARYVLAYAGNYLLNLGFLGLTRRVFVSDYVSMAVASFAASFVNFFALKYLVFGKRTSPVPSPACAPRQ